jgi:lipopolysaccharide/colanic/teichoic acid biosynthesis glycosyltransferase
MAPSIVDLNSLCVEASPGPRIACGATLDPERLGPRPLYGASKRVLDVTLSLLLLCLLSPLLLLIAVLIKWEDGGPVLFGQIRAGLGGRTFRLYKFRSMCVDAERQRDALRALQASDSPRFKLERDPRVTRTGYWLRRFSLDEIPQFWNVVVGDLSLVGPRPALPEEVAQYEADHFRRLDVAPGVTCTWQVSGRSLIPFEQQVELDLAYIRTRSLLVDTQILLRTVPAVLSGRGAY